MAITYNTETCANNKGVSNFVNVAFWRMDLTALTRSLLAQLRRKSSLETEKDQSKYDQGFLILSSHGNLLQLALLFSP